MTILTRVRAAWRRYARAPMYDAIADQYGPGCRCKTWPLCPDVPAEVFAEILADYAADPVNMPRLSSAIAQDVLRWNRTLAVLGELATQWERLGYSAGSFALCAEQLRNCLGEIRRADA